MIERAELHDAAQKAFPADGLKPQREDSWRKVADLGWLMIPVPEDAGGLGLGREAAGAVVLETGRVLATAPLLPALVVLQGLAASTTLADRDGWIERALSGAFITLSLGDGSPLRWEEGRRALSGTLSAVADADMASDVLVFAPGTVALVPLSAPGVSLLERPLWDESRRLFDVTLQGVEVAPERVVAEGEAAAEMAQRLRIELLVGLAADSIGGAHAILDRTVEYLKTRRQFDRPLAMFQALKHRCADLATAIEAAEALLWTWAADPGLSLAQAGALKAQACDVYRFACEEAIQLHGGIGLTDELYCHLFMKRANLNVHLAGDGDRWLLALGQEMLGSPGNHAAA